MPKKKLLCCVDGHLVERGEGVGYVRVLLADHRPPAPAVVGRSRRLLDRAPVPGGRRRPPARPPVAAAEQGAEDAAHAPAAVAKTVEAAARRWQPCNMRGSEQKRKGAAVGKGSENRRTRRTSEQADGTAGMEKIKLILLRWKGRDFDREVAMKLREPFRRSSSQHCYGRVRGGNIFMDA